MSSTVKPTARKDEIVIQEVDNEVLVYDLKTNKALCLNQTSAAVWRKCDGLTSIKKIKEKLSKETHSPVTDELVWLALDQLKKEDLIEAEQEIRSPFDGLSRREVIKRIGIGSMMALPVIFALVAPSPAHAASSCVVMLGACLCNAASPVGTDCTATQIVMCAANCRCVSTGTTPLTADNCVA